MSNASAAFAPVRREPLSMAVARQLRAAILAGELVAGEPLPSENQLTEQLGVGRSTVREALRILQAQGLVTGGDHVSTRGPVIGGPIHERAADALSTVVAMDGIELRDLVELRLLLECDAIDRAARLPDPNGLRDAREALAAARRAGADVEAFHRADVAFHTALVEASGNKAYELVMRVLRTAMEAHLHDSLAESADPAATIDDLCDEHEAILEALEAGDASFARASLRNHLVSFYFGGDA